MVSADVSMLFIFWYYSLLSCINNCNMSNYGSTLFISIAELSIFSIMLSITLVNSADELDSEIIWVIEIVNSNKLFWL